MAWKMCFVVTLASALSARPCSKASALLSEPRSSVPSAGKGRGGEGRGGRHSPLEVCREAGRPWGCPAPGLVLAGAKVQSLFCPQTFPGCPGSPRPCLTELYVPGGPPSAERGTSPPGALTSADAALAVSLFLSPDSLIPPLLLASSLLPMGMGVEFWGLSPQMT